MTAYPPNNLYRALDDARVTDRGLRNLWKKLYAMQAASGTPYPHAKWVISGDSMAADILQYAFTYLYRAFGGQAGAYGGGPTAIGGVTTNAATAPYTDNTTDFDVWPYGNTRQFGTNGATTYGLGGASWPCDKIKVYYVKGPASAKDGGTFKVQVDGVDTVTGISTVAGALSLGVVSINPVLGPHTVTVVCTAGPMRILPIVGLENTSIRGMVPIITGQGGISLTQGLASAWSIFSSFLADLQPDVISTEVKDLSATYRAGLASLFDSIAAGWAACDVIGMGSAPVLPPQDDNDQVIQNRILKDVCDQRGYSYWDGYGPLGSPAVVAALGWGADPVHLDPPAHQYKAARFLQDLNIPGFLGQGWPYDISASIVKTATEVALGKNASDRMGRIAADATFDQDLQIGARRWLKFMNLGLSVEVARLDLGGNNLDLNFLPRFIRFGDTAKAGIWGQDGSTLVVAQTASVSSPGDLYLRRVRIPNAAANVSGAVTADLQTSACHVLTLTGNITSFAFLNGAGNEDIELHLVQGAGGPWTIAGINAAIKFAGGAAPVLSGTIGWRDIFVFRLISGVFYEISRSLAVR